MVTKINTRTKGIISERGVYQNIKDSDYIVTDGELLFFFSSPTNIHKFLERYSEHRNEQDKRMKRIFGEETMVNHNLLYDLKLYKDIEKRGFHVWHKNVELREEDVKSFAVRKMLSDSNTSYSIVGNLVELREIIAG